MENQGNQTGKAGLDESNITVPVKGTGDARTLGRGGVTLFLRKDARTGEKLENRMTPGERM